MAKSFGILSALTSLILGTLPLQAQQTAEVNVAGESMNHTRFLLQKWAETEKMIAAERNEWEQGKTLLEGRISLVQQSIEDMKKKIAEAEEKLADARKRAAEVEAEKKQAKEASDELLAQAPELEMGIRGILARVPRHTLEKVKVLADRIPKEGVDVKNISAAERFQNVLGILNELNKANQEIASLPEIHDVGGGKKAEAKTIYVGLGQGYFVNAAGDLAGIGTPGTSGWVWQADRAIAKEMLEVLEVMKKAVSPKLVELPATID
ncbi:MAG TPA: DUF3450 family protein [Prosthecobacter sp.]|nr:DUF3450 family protein [Prosthecobacter sp.]